MNTGGAVQILMKMGDQKDCIEFYCSECHLTLGFTGFEELSRRNPTVPTDEFLKRRLGGLRLRHQAECAGRQARGQIVKPPARSWWRPRRRAEPNP